MTIDNPFEITTDAKLLLTETGGEYQDNAIYKAITGLIDSTLDFVINDEQVCKMYNGYTYAREFKTFKVSGSRGGGHTTAIKMLAEEYVPSMIVVPKITMLQNCYREYNQNQLGYQPRVYIPTCKNLLEARHQQYGQCEYAICFLDNASFFDDEQLDNVYALLHDKVLVFALIQ